MSLEHQHPEVRQHPLILWKDCGDGDAVLLHDYVSAVKVLSHCNGSHSDLQAFGDEQAGYSSPIDARVYLFAVGVSTFIGRTEIPQPSQL